MPCHLTIISTVNNKNNMDLELITNMILSLSVRYGILEVNKDLRYYKAFCVAVVRNILILQWFHSPF